MFPRERARLASDQTCFFTDGSIVSRMSRLEFTFSTRFLRFNEPLVKEQLLCGTLYSRLCFRAVPFALPPLLIFQNLIKST